MVHDRRIDGQTYFFGNTGVLYNTAMTWWDHTTGSIWSQPTGSAIGGPLQDTRLPLLPSQITTWESWLAQYPNTFVMINDLDRMHPLRDGFRDDFVIGIQFGDETMAIYFEDLKSHGIIETYLGDYPILAWGAQFEYRVYLRQLENQILTFYLKNDQVFDHQTHSRWDMALGFAIDGPLTGQALQHLPSMSSYDWAWLDFYPNSEIYLP